MKIAFLQNSYAGGGAEKTALILAAEFSRRGHTTMLIANKTEGPLLREVPSAVQTWPLAGRGVQLSRLTPLRADPLGLRELWLPVILGNPPPRTIRYLHSLKDVLRRERPDLLVSMTPFITLEAIWARRLAGVSTRLLNVQQNHLSRWLDRRKGRRHRKLLPLLLRSYRDVESFVAVSNGVADNLSEITGLSRQSIVTIHNPALTPELSAMAGEAVDHPWFRQGEPPVVLTVGRLGEQKDHPTLLRAFARVRAHREARLMILGEAPNAQETQRRIVGLHELARSLSVEKDVDLPGYQPNPFKFMSRAAVFVLTSRFEGLGNVLIEALACGCPVVSTDCESGPAEILDHGRYGRLVPVGDVDKVAEAILLTLDSPCDPDYLKIRAEQFSVGRVAAKYEELMSASVEAD